MKAAVVSRAIAAYNARAGSVRLTEAILHTGQHYDHNMSGVFFAEMEIPEPAVNLSIGSGLHGETTGAMIAGIEREIIGRKPDIVLVYGDTNSTMAGALAAAKLNVPVAHVEAGLRSFNRRMPEEINRVVTDHVASILLCPSKNSAEQLAREGVTEGVHVTGDVMYDAIVHYRKKAEPVKIDGPFALCTIHRAENTDDPERLAAIFAGLATCPIKIILPLHPRTRGMIERTGIALPENVDGCEPFSYLATLSHLASCSFVITDSGGLQKEAYFSGRKCVTLRDETEWTELVDAGANVLAGADPDRMASAMRWALSKSAPVFKPVYGDGNAGGKIVEILAGS